MFTEIRAVNFKSWARLTPDATADDAAQIDSRGLPLGKVTGLFGPNSAGKTGSLQPLLLLKQTAESADRRSPLDFGDRRSPIMLGSFADFIRDHSETLPLGLGLSWKLDELIAIINPETEEVGPFATEELALDTEIASLHGAMLVERFSYRSGDNVISCRRTIRDSFIYSLHSTVNGRENFLQPIGGGSWKLDSPVKCYGFPERARGYYRFAGILEDLAFSFEEQLRRTYYLGPLRDIPQATYAWTGATPAHVGYDGASAIPVLLSAQKSGERKNFRAHSGSSGQRELITVEQHVAEWLQELGLLHSFRVAPVAEGVDIYRAYARRSESSPEVLLTDVGFGVSQVLPVLVLLAYVPEGSTVILEQPEIHLHPAVQSGLADVILEAALVRNVQVLLESHSEHLLMRLQLRVAEEQLANGTPVSAADIRLWFIDQEGPVSQAHDLQMNEYGEITNWPKDFFGNQLEETARIVKVGLRRRRDNTEI